jgi:hypothetical protein
MTERDGMILDCLAPARFAVNTTDNGNEILCAGHASETILYSGGFVAVVTLTPEEIATMEAESKLQLDKWFLEKLLK